MPNKQHIVDLSEDERAELESFVSSGVHKAEDITRVRILLKADDGATDAEISRALGCEQSMPYRVRKRYADRGIAAIHRRNPDREYERKLDGEDEATLSPSRPASRPSAALAGRFVFSPTNSLPSKRSITNRSPMRLFARYSKKRTAASPIQTMGDSA